MSEFVHLQHDAAPGVATIRLDRPKMNALSNAVSAEIAAVAEELRGRSDTRAAVLWGGPRIFAAGADIKEFRPGGSGGGAGAPVSLTGALRQLECIPQVLVAAVNGYALGGGCELAMAADFRVAADDAVFGQPEILLGIIPGAGGTQRLPRLVGLSRAKEIIYSGRRVTAEEALAIGLADAVHPAAETYDRAVAMAERFAAGPAALRYAKTAMNDGFGLPLDDALDLESREFVAAFATEDARIGVQSFVEHGPGKASFVGR
ncbi:MAG: enoyl-CoA hydratase/isomerase family protein [Acidimicrobiia bacterium]|nr:enoyl-CoA hydratase/isomerase family protein [Acidimicrobiia bacterium]MYC46267.1 enoyl-CoA hydratase/isomerase family protein [Acidimicrobiia bacterium]MYI20934.1 enoyl-CoA hydratase/isomerase family protein [Acidimicrobiia bacterium]